MCFQKREKSVHIMFKRVLILALALCLVISFVGCGGPSEMVGRPDNWDLEAEVLRYCNGSIRAKTAEELRPYVVSNISDASVKAHVDANNASMEQVMAEAVLDYRDYPYDSVEVTLLDTYKNYEVLWVNLSSSAYNQAVEELDPSNAPVSYVGIGPAMLIVTIENGHYVGTIDESLINEVQAMYDYCMECHGMGTYGILCAECYGSGMRMVNVCSGCNEEVTFDFSSEDQNSVIINSEGNSDALVDSSLELLPIQGVITSNYTCSNCGVTDYFTTEKPCTACQGASDTMPCDACDGKGWIKK